MGHARSILSLKNPIKQIALSERIARDDLSVREVEQIISSGKPIADPAKSPMSIKLTPKLIKSPQILDLEDGLRRAVGTKVSIMERNGKGKITIEFSNNAQFEGIVAKLNALTSPHVK